MMFRYVLAWVPMVLIAILNGILRETTYGKSLQELQAHQLSTVIGILLFSIYIGILTYFWRFASLQQALTVGLVWMGLTIAFEFLFGHYVAHHSWSHLLRDYNLFAGRLWVIILGWLVLAPMLFYRGFESIAP